MYDFFVLAGDANRDRAVDFQDLVVLAQHYNTLGGNTWATGDFTGDGNVDFAELVRLAQNYNTILPAPPAAVAPVPRAGAVVAVPAKRAAPATKVRAIPVAASNVSKPVTTAFNSRKRITERGVWN